MEPFTTESASLLMKGTGTRINSMERAYSTTKTLYSSFSPSTTPILTLSKIIGSVMKVPSTIIAGEFEYDNKHGPGRLLLANGEYFEGQFEKDCIHG